MVEKPIGHALASALEINRIIGALVDESQIIRIDHYLLPGQRDRRESAGNPFRQ
jgi:glucose-6-phosphate 1-dehydrogenase